MSAPLLPSPPSGPSSLLASESGRFDGSSGTSVGHAAFTHSSSTGASSVGLSSGVSVVGRTAAGAAAAAHPQNSYHPLSGGGAGSGARPPAPASGFAPYTLGRLQLNSAYSLHGGGRGDWGWPQLLRNLRALGWSRMDVDYGLYQLAYSALDPTRVGKLTTHRKQTKNRWHRDDPAATVLLAGFVVASAVAYGIAYGSTSLWGYLWLVQGALASFGIFGAMIATGLWAGINRFARSGGPFPHAVEQRVEWLYAWDVHVNAYTAILLTLHVAHYFLLPLLLPAEEGILSVLLGNALYAVALSHYCYITFWGYAVLPFLQQDKLRMLLLPVAAAGIMFVLLTVFRLNLARFVMSWTVAV